MITLNNIIYKPSLRLNDSSKLIKHSVFSALTQYSSSEDNPMFSTIQRTIISENEKFNDLNILDVDTSGAAVKAIESAPDFAFNTAYAKGAVFNHKGRAYSCPAAITIADVEEFKVAIIAGTIRPIFGGLSDDLSAVNYIHFNDVALRGQAVMRHSAMTISHEAIQDLRAYGSDPDKVITDTLIVPTINDIDREVVYKSMLIAKKRPAITATNTNQSGRDLLVAIEQERQRIFSTTGRTPDYCVCSTPVLGLLLGTGLINAWEEVEIIETEIELADGEKETHTEELSELIPNKYISRSGIVFQASDLLADEQMDYFLLSVKTHKDNNLAPLYLHSYQPDQSFMSLYEFISSTSMQPSIRASTRYGVMAGPFFSRDEKLVQADSDEYFESQRGKNPLVSFTSVSLPNVQPDVEESKV